MFFAAVWAVPAYLSCGPLSPIFAFVATLYWSRAINAHLHIENAVQVILVRFRRIPEVLYYISKYYAVTATIIIILLTLFVWALIKHQT